MKPKWMKRGTKDYKQRITRVMNVYDRLPSEIRKTIRERSYPFPDLEILNLGMLIDNGASYIELDTFVHMICQIQDQIIEEKKDENTTAPH